ncbi:MAG: YbhB/YbcL family Raf kinase inhibitor-like protein [Candidatus Levybacteria bacterium]|nr:YbhB/YbcL family Raf kinase inhibitor-like protein [Candidatus Levybacteria bacterium]
MKIKSPVFSENQIIPTIYTCDGDNINPHLDILETPANAQSLALIMDDPDAPNGTFTHWMMWNISPQIKEIPEGGVPEGAIQGLNSGGRVGYFPPCPPTGMHHYYFKIYALNRKLNITPNISREELEREIDGSIIDKAQLVGTYQRGN